MYEMLRGEPPFKSGNIIYHHIFTAPEPIPGLPDAASEIIMKCLEKKPEKRYATMDELISALERMPLS